jgi:hypothetical protein
MPLYQKLAAIYLAAFLVLCLILLIERALFWLSGSQEFSCGRCALHGTDAEHDLHVSQKLPDPFTGKRPREEQQ